MIQKGSGNYRIIKTNRFNNSEKNVVLENRILKQGRQKEDKQLVDCMMKDRVGRYYTNSN